MKPRNLVFTLIALGLAISAGPMQGQSLSFFRPETTKFTADSADVIERKFALGYFSNSRERPSTD